MSRKTQRVVLKSQAREIISKVYDFMKKEASNNYAEKLTDARWRTAQAVGVSERTITRILRERKADGTTLSAISDMQNRREDIGSASENVLQSSLMSSADSNDTKCRMETNSGYNVLIKTEPGVEEGVLSRQKTDIVLCSSVKVKCEFESDSECNIPSKTDIVHNEEGPALLKVTDIKVESISDTKYAVPLTTLKEQPCIVKTEPEDEVSIQEGYVHKTVFVRLKESEGNSSEGNSSTENQLQTRGPTLSKEIFIRPDVPQAKTSKSKKNCTLQPDLTYHGGEKPYKCNVCEHRFPRKDRMLTHYRTHTGEKPYECKVCYKRFSEQSSFIVHSRIHTGEKPYQCDVCKKRFSIHANLVKHLRTHTGVRPFECTICNSRFTQKGHLQGHLRTHTGEKPFECHVCHKRYISSSRLKIHSRAHTGEKPYQCNICQSRFRGSKVLKAHIRTHTGERPYECDICHKRCSQKSNLRTHIKSHSGEKKHICNICQCGFTRNTNLQKHLRNHHL